MQGAGPDQDASETKHRQSAHQPHDTPVRFGAHLLQLIGAIAVAYVVLHFILKYW